LHSHRVGTLEIDKDRLAKELEQAKSFPFFEPYEEFDCARPTRHEGQVMLWAPGGEPGDGIISHYDEDRESSITEYGRQLPYVRQIMEESLSLRHLRFARLVGMTSNVLVPHRDYVEFDASQPGKRPAHRLHIPLATNENCAFSEDNVVYRMAAGEVWFLDVTRVHSAAALTDELRLHLIVDFTDVDDHAELVGIETSDERVIPPSSIVHREPLSGTQRQALLSLADALDSDNLRDVFSIIAKKHFRYDGGNDFFWDTVGKIRDRLADRALAAHLAELHDYFVCQRAE
jgi:hypothetical protein